MLTAPVGTGRTTRERAAVVVAARWQIQEPQRQQTVRQQKLRMENGGYVYASRGNPKRGGSGGGTHPRSLSGDGGRGYARRGGYCY